MLYLHRVPGPPLDAFIASLWYCRSQPQPSALQRVLPGGAAQLIVNLKEDQTRVYRPDLESGATTLSSGTILSGAQSRYCVIDTAEQEYVAGAAFKPGGAAPFFRIPAHEIHNASVSLDLLWGNRVTARLRDQLLNAANPHAALDILERTLAESLQPSALHPAVVYALETFSRRPHDASIAAVTAMTGLSPKRFIERFKISVGLTPKLYCRILRFQGALTRATGEHRVDWTRIAADCCYFDQAHFNHDFREFAGLTPTAYQAARTEFQNHVKFLQSDIVAP